MLSVNSNHVMNSYTVSAVRPYAKMAETAPTNNAYASRPSFCGVTGNDISIRTTLATKDEKKKYNHLTKSLDKEGRKMLNALLKNGSLLKNDSNDKSTTLDNLHKMVTEPRATGMDANLLLKHTVNTIYNPYIITQHFGDIPKEYENDVINKLTNNSQDETKRKTAKEEITDLFSGCCVAASEEFNLASTNPAEFARFAEGLTSPKKSVEKIIKLDSLSEKALDAIWLLNAFEIPYEAKDFKNVKITISPDENAYIREHIQERHQDPYERSPIDVLMQSAFMNIGSQQTYNTLNDKRAGKFSNDDRGLIDFEKTFLESVVEDKNITSVTYQKVDDNQKIIGYEADYDTVKNQLLETLNSGKNIIIGYTMTDEEGYIKGGHEITIVGSKTDRNGELSFICNDTDDDNPKLIEYPASYLIPMIHHAGIPTEIAEKNLTQVDNWVLGVREFNEMIKNKG